MQEEESINMTPELQQRWASALRSGNYTQTTGTMKRIHSDNSSSYCCLGVLCEITGYTFEPKFEYLTTLRVAGERHYHNNPNYPNYPNYPSSDSDVTGFPSDKMLTGWEFNKTAADKLASLNDSGATFEEIAKIVEDLDSYEIKIAIEEEKGKEGGY